MNTISVYMESNKNKEFLDLIKRITKITSKDEKGISIAVGRNKGYISQLKSRMKKGDEVPQSFIDLLKLRFANDLKEGKERINFAMTEDDYFNERSALAIARSSNIRVMAQEIKELKAIVKELMKRAEAVAPLEIDRVSAALDFDRAVERETLRGLDQLKNESS